MIKQHRSYTLQLVIGLSIFFLLGIGLQVSRSYAAYDGCAYNPEIRVDRCHLDPARSEAKRCCQSEACHQTAADSRNLGGPGYHTLTSYAHLLIHESRTQTPQLKAGTPFIDQLSPPAQIVCRIKTPDSPLQSLGHLQTIVLLN